MRHPDPSDEEPETEWHSWDLRGTTAQDRVLLTVWQCRQCGRAAKCVTEFTTIGSGQLVQPPSIDEPCDALIGDGGQVEPADEHNRIGVGDIVSDREAEEDETSLARVMDIPGTTAAEEPIDYLDQTVAEANPSYPADDPVIHIKFLSPLDDRPQGTTYSYPYSRLRRADEDEKGLRMDVDERGESA